jgi:hypothetical protein
MRLRSEAKCSTRTLAVVYLTSFLVPHHNYLDHVMSPLLMKIFHKAGMRRRSVKRTPQEMEIFGRQELLKGIKEGSLDQTSKSDVNDFYQILE